MSEFYWWQLFAWIGCREAAICRTEWTTRKPGWWGRPLVEPDKIKLVNLGDMMHFEPGMRGGYDLETGEIWQYGEGEAWQGPIRGDQWQHISHVDAERGVITVSDGWGPREFEYHEGALARLAGEVAADNVIAEIHRRTYESPYASFTPARIHGKASERFRGMAIRRVATGTYTITMDEAANWDEPAAVGLMRGGEPVQATPGPRNRHERRKAAALARRGL